MGQNSDFNRLTDFVAVQAAKEAETSARPRGANR
jgi:hypothetical protein